MLRAELQVERARATSTKKTDDDDDDDVGFGGVTDGPFCPHYWERDAPSQNPHRPLRDRNLPEAPHVYHIKNCDNEYLEVLRTRRNQSFHEYHLLSCLVSYFWDANEYFDEIGEELSSADPDRQASVQALQNQYREIYGVLNRRKYVIELRTRVNCNELESDAEDERILSEIEARVKDFRSGYADMADVDPHIRKWVTQFKKKADRASFSQAYKDAGKAKAAKRNSKPQAPRRRAGKPAAAKAAGAGA